MRKRASDHDVVVYDKDQEKAKSLGLRFDVQPADSLKLLCYESVIIIIAVKPQDMEEVCGQMKGLVRKVIISIAAGVTLPYLESKFGKDMVIVRAMPNINAMIGHGVTGLSFNKNAGDEDKAIVKKIFESVGAVVFVPESQMNAVTAISGSGPAFVAYLVNDLGEKVIGEVMMREAAAFGIEASVAKRLAETTISGTRRMLATNFDAKILIQRVSSKGGTTEAGMNILEQKGKTAEALSAAIQAACRRAAELSKS